ncbi:MAG: hypothetical protein R3C28_25060, partial [Pirellulaceae bacterium]
MQNTFGFGNSSAAFRCNLVVLFSLLWSATAQAHFLFVDSTIQGEHRAARLVFSETAGEPGLLPDSIKQADFTVVRFDDESVQTLEVAEVDGNPFMRSPPLHSPALLIAKCTYGVHKKILLHYTAKHWTDMTSLPIEPESAPELDMTLQQSGNTLTLHVRWQGKPLADANVVYQHGDDQA